MNTRNRTIRLAALALVVVLAGACSVKKVDEAHVGVGYTDGPIEGKKFDGVVEPGGSRTVVNDHVYMLPARQITYQTGNVEAGADGPTLRVTAKGGEAMDIDLAVRSFLNTREDTVKQFFLEICQKDRRHPDGSMVDGCWDNASEKGGDGWDLMLQETFGNPAQAVAKDVALSYDADDLRYDNATKDEYATAFAEDFRSSQRRLIGNGEYFCGPGYDRDVTNEDSERWCPPLSVEITSIRFASDEREGIREQQALAERQEQLAAQEAQTARAQQEVVAAQATPEWVAQQQAVAMTKCAENPECQLTVIVGNDQVGVTVPAR